MPTVENQIQEYPRKWLIIVAGDDVSKMFQIAAELELETPAKIQPNADSTIDHQGSVVRIDSDEVTYHITFPDEAAIVKFNRKLSFS